MSGLRRTSFSEKVTTFKKYLLLLEEVTALKKCMFWIITYSYLQEEANQKTYLLPRSSYKKALAAADNQVF